MSNFALLKIGTAAAPVAVTVDGSIALDANVGYCTMLAVDANLGTPTGTTPGITLTLERQGLDGVWYPLWTSPAQTAAGELSVSLGPGLPTAATWGGSVRLGWTVAGTTPSWPISASVIGR